MQLNLCLEVKKSTRALLSDFMEENGFNLNSNCKAERVTFFPNRYQIDGKPKLILSFERWGAREDRLSGLLLQSVIQAYVCKQGLLGRK